MSKAENLYKLTFVLILIKHKNRIKYIIKRYKNLNRKDNNSRYLFKII